jgi:hypothetical protein
MNTIQDVIKAKRKLRLEIKTLLEEFERDNPIVISNPVLFRHDLNPEEWCFSFHVMIDSVKTK